MAEEENALALFLKEHSCARLFAVLLIKHGCTSLIDHGKLLHTLLYLCKDVYDRVDIKELYNRFFERKIGIHPLLIPRCKCDRLAPRYHHLKKTHVATYTILKETGNLDGPCEKVVSRKDFKELRKVVYKNGKRIGLQIHTGQFDLPHRVFSYHENGIKKQELRRNDQSEHFHYKAEFNEYGQKLRVYSSRKPDYTLLLLFTYHYDNDKNPPRLKRTDAYNGDVVSFSYWEPTYK